MSDRTNLVERIARMIDAEGAYSTWMNSADADAKQHPFSTRQLYFQSSYELKAIEILKALAGVPLETIRADLIEWEKLGWERLGININQDAETKTVADDVIAKKYVDLGATA